MTVEYIETGLPALSQPFSWAVAAGRILFTAHGPVDAEGRIAGADIEAQTRLTLQNLERAVKAAGATLQDVAQVLVYVGEAAEIPAMDSVYRSFFSVPYPNRSTVGGLSFAHPAMKIEMVAYVCLPERVVPGFHKASPV